jgi:transposase
VREPATLSEGERQAVEDMQAACPAVAMAYPLAKEFATMVRQRSPTNFPAWLERVCGSGVADLVAFGAGLRRDEAAVVAALTYPWSNGQTEGQVTRLKLLKRQIYGRAKLDLLRCRVLGSS